MSNNSGKISPDEVQKMINDAIANHDANKSSSNISTDEIVAKIEAKMLKQQRLKDQDDIIRREKLSFVLKCCASILFALGSIFIASRLILQPEMLSSSSQFSQNTPAQSAAMLSQYKKTPKAKSYTASDIQAAAMLLALSKARAAAPNSNRSFESDVGSLVRVMYKSPKLQSSIKRLSKHANNGVLDVQRLEYETDVLASNMLSAALTDEEFNVNKELDEHYKKLANQPPSQSKTKNIDTILETADYYMQSGQVSAAVEEYQKLEDFPIDEVQQRVRQGEYSSTHDDLTAVVIFGMLDHLAKGKPLTLDNFEEVFVQSLPQEWVGIVEQIKQRYPRPTASDLPPMPSLGRVAF